MAKGSTKSSKGNLKFYTVELVGLQQFGLVNLERKLLYTSQVKDLAPACTPYSSRDRKNNLVKSGQWSD